MIKRWLNWKDGDGKGDWTGKKVIKLERGWLNWKKGEGKGDWKWKKGD